MLPKYWTTKTSWGSAAYIFDLQESQHPEVPHWNQWWWCNKLCLHFRRWVNFRQGSDLTVKSGLLGKDWAKGDVLMADRGFEIQDDIAPMGVKLNILPFLKGKTPIWGRWTCGNSTHCQVLHSCWASHWANQKLSYLGLCSYNIVLIWYYWSNFLCLCHVDKLSATISVRWQGNQ